MKFSDQIFAFFGFYVLSRRLGPAINNKKHLYQLYAINLISDVAFTPPTPALKVFLQLF